MTRLDEVLEILPDEPTAFALIDRRARDIEILAGLLLPRESAVSASSRSSPSGVPPVADR